MLLTIRRIRLANFMTHRDEELELPERGTFLLWGPSGAGKSSLLEAVPFALFGVRATRASSLEELRHELYPEEDLEVELTLGLSDGQEVVVHRGIQGSKSVAWLIEPDGTRLEGLTAVSKRVGELMGGMDGPTFFATYFSPQGELDSLIRMAGGERRKFVQRMLGITLLDQVTKRISKEIDKTKERIDLLSESLPASSREELQQVLTQARQRQDKLAADLADAEREAEAQKLQGKSLAEKAEAARTQANRHRELSPKLQALTQTTLPSLEEQIKQLEDSIRQAEEAGARVKASGNTLAELKRLRDEAKRLADAEGALQLLSQLKRQLEEQTSRQAELERELKQLPSGKAADEHDEQRTTRQLHEVMSELARVEAQLADAKANHERLSREGACFTCLRPLPDGPEAEQVLSALNQLIQRLEREHREAFSRKQDTEKQLADLKQARQAAGEVERRRQQLQARLEQMAEQIAQLRRQLAEAEEKAKQSDAARLQEVRTRLDELAEQAGALQADQQLASELPALRKKLETLRHQHTRHQQERDQIQRELEQLAFDPDQHEQLEQRLDQAREAYSELRARIGQLRGELHAAQRDYADAEKALESFDKLLGDRQKLMQRQAQLQRLEETMKQFKTHMIGQIRPALEARTSQHLSALSEGRMPAVRIDEEYNLFVRRHGEFRRIGLCSGGEQARAAFALRLALTQLVSSRTDTPVGFMVFDEIFGSQDEEHRRGILEGLKLLGSIYPQVFLISHEEGMRESELIDMVISIPDAESTQRIRIDAR